MLAMKQQRALEDCQADCAAAVDEKNPDEAARARKDEAVAIAEAMHALQGLACRQILYVQFPMCVGTLEVAGGGARSAGGHADHTDPFCVQNVDVPM